MASRLTAKPEIQARIAELRNRQEEAKIYTDINDINKRFAIIWEQIEKCRANNDNASIARYMDIINKMTGTYVNISKDITDDKPLKNLTDDEIKALIGG
jgi:hypothetical protein